MSFFNLTFWPVLLGNIAWLVWISHVPMKRARRLGDKAYGTGKEALAAQLAGNWEKAEAKHVECMSLYGQCFAQHEADQRLLMRNRIVTYVLLAYAFFNLAWLIGGILL